MKTSMLVWKYLVVIALITVFELILVHGKRQKPRHDEIEVVINDTHSNIRKCSDSECPPGTGLTVSCGTSISLSTPLKCVFCVNGVNYSNTHDYSTCKSCRNCGKHQNKKGRCTREEDTTECLRTCIQGFYMDKITEDCHQCSDCCGEAGKHHEKQCEDSGLPPTQQCRRTTAKCHEDPPDNDTVIPEKEDPARQESLQASEIAAIAVSSTVFLVIIVVIFVIWKHCGWQQFKSILKEWCCCCCNLMKSNAGTTVNFHISDHFEGPDCDLELGALCINGSGSPLVAKETDDIGSPSDHRVRTTRTASNRAGFQRQLSVPVETRSDTKLTIPRSRSHPGCLVDLNKHAQGSSDFKLGGLKKLVDPKTRKLAKKGYAPVAVELPEIDDLPLAKDCLPNPTSSACCELSENSLQSVGSMVEDRGKERSEKPRDQSTSTTELHLPSTTLQVAGVQQDFLNSLLKKSMSAIPNKFYRKICIKLDTIRPLHWDDFRLLGEKVGLDKDEIALLEQMGNPTKRIIDKFNSQKNSCIWKFKAILEEMGRNDVVTVIEEWVVDEWNSKRNNNSSSSTNCGKGYKLQSFV